MSINRPIRVLLFSGVLVALLATGASAQCGMYSMGLNCVPPTLGGGMTCTGNLFIGCNTVIAGPMGGNLTMAVPCSGTMPLPGFGVMVVNSLAPGVFPFMGPPAGGATCAGTAGSATGTRMATAMGMGTAAGCRVGWSLRCAVTGIDAMGNPTTMSDCMAGGNQAIARACDFTSTSDTPGLPVELMEFSVEGEASGD